jgi:hypothetical protein
MSISFYVITGLLAALFAAIHLAGNRLTFLWTVPRSVWLSAAGGVSVAYVFVHLLPELADRQADFSDAAPTSILGELERHAYLLALLGLTVFYGLDRLARRTAQRSKTRSSADGPPRASFWVHLGAFAAYNTLIGYLLLQRESLGGLAAFAVAMGLHFLVNDQGLREHHGDAYRDTGRWLLAAAPVWVGHRAALDTLCADRRRAVRAPRRRGCPQCAEGGVAGRPGQPVLLRVGCSGVRRPAVVGALSLRGALGALASDRRPWLGRGDSDTGGWQGLLLAPVVGLRRKASRRRRRAREARRVALNVNFGSRRWPAQVWRCCRGARVFVPAILARWFVIRVLSPCSC